MTTAPATVFIVDDEEQSRESVCALVQSMRYPTQTFDSAETFLQQYRGGAGCVVTDYRMTGMNGIELQEKLIEWQFDIPIVMVTAFARTSMAVKAIQNGAITVLDKPYSEDDLWSAIRDGLSIDKQRREEKQQQADLNNRMASLKENERQVLDLMLAGEPNKAMAHRMDVSLRTIENRRRAVFSKLGAQTVAELVTLVVNQRPSGTK